MLYIDSNCIPDALMYCYKYIQAWEGEMCAVGLGIWRGGESECVHVLCLLGFAYKYNLYFNYVE